MGGIYKAADGKTPRTRLIFSLRKRDVREDSAQPWVIPAFAAMMEEVLDFRLHR